MVLSGKNAKRQAFCNRPACQRFRRTEAQRQRRKRAKAEATLTRLLKPSEADWLRRNPLIVGLISMLIGSSDRKEIEACCAALIERGQKIQNGTLFEAPQKSHVSSGLGERKSE